MNLQENISRIKQVMRLNEDNDSIVNGKLLEKILNNQMPEKYPWWKHIDIEEVQFHESVNVFGRKNNQTIIIHGTLYVDSVWVREEWEEYTVSPFPDYSDNLRLTTIINTGEIDQIFSDIKEYYQIITGIELKKVKDSHLIVRLVDKDF